MFGAEQRKTIDFGTSFSTKVLDFFKWHVFWHQIQKIGAILSQTFAQTNLRGKRSLVQMETHIHPMGIMGLVPYFSQRQSFLRGMRPWLRSENSWQALSPSF